MSYTSIHLTIYTSTLMIVSTVVMKLFYNNVDFEDQSNFPIYGSFTPKLNFATDWLQSGFQLPSVWLQTGKIQLGYISLAWLNSH